MRNQEYIDDEGRKWITPTRVAQIWNERAKQEKGIDTRYTRWSVFKRREKLSRMQTPLGDLFLESEARSIRLSPHPARPDVAERHQRQRDGKQTKE